MWRAWPPRGIGGTLGAEAVTLGRSTRVMWQDDRHALRTKILIVFGDDPERIRSDAVFARRVRSWPLLEDHRPISHRPPPGERRPLSSRHRPHAIPSADRRLRRAPPRERPDHTRNVRDLKHVLARELYYRVMTDVRARQAIFQVA